MRRLGDFFCLSIHLVLQEIRRVIVRGDIARAILLINELQPDLLRKTKLAFRLYKQQFIELAKTTEYSVALHYLQTQFAPCALTVDPDAFTEFKQTLVGLLFNNKQQEGLLGVCQRPCDDDWSTSKREELANIVYGIVMKSMNIREPTLALGLRYLMLVHNVYHALRGGDVAVPEVEELLLPDRDEEEGEDFLTDTYGEAGITDACDAEVDQDDAVLLSQAVGISRSRARTSILRARGSTEEAIIAELSRMHISKRLMNSLCVRYYVYRGFNSVTPDGVDMAYLDESPDQTRISAAIRNICQIGLESPDSISPSHNPAALILQELRQLGLDAYEKLCRHNLEKRGEFDYQSLESCMITPQLYFALKQCEFLGCLKVNQWDKGLEIMRAEMSPLTLTYPELTKLLMDCALLMAYRDALKTPPQLSCSIFNVDGEKFGLYHQHNQECMDTGNDKDVHVVVEEVWEKFNPSVLVGPLRTALAFHTGLSEAPLVSLISRLLAVHTKCFEYQQSDDRFQHLFHLEELKKWEYYRQPMRPRLCNLCKTRFNSSGCESAMDIDKEVTVNDIENDDEFQKAEEDARNHKIDDTAIYYIQEVMACSRVEAIQLLIEHDGNPQAALQDLFS